MKTCICCKNPIEGQKCEFCGFMNIAALDNNAIAKLNEKAEVHRKSLLEKINNIQVASYSYKVSVGKPVLEGTNYIVIAESGSDCYDQIVWSNEKFAPNPSRKKGTRSLKVQYSVDGKKKDISVNIPLENFDNMWSLGVIINQDFTIQFYLGGSDNYTQSANYQLELK